MVLLESPMLHNYAVKRVIPRLYQYKRKDDKYWFLTPEQAKILILK